MRAFGNMIAITDNRASFVLSAIRRHSTDPATWRRTSIAELRPQLVGRVQLRNEESVLVSSWDSVTDWYVFTSERAFGATDGKEYEATIGEISEYEVDQFKLPEGGTFDLRLVLAHGQKLRVKCEAGKASMAPIYFLRTVRKGR
jgi:hypothetical protein